MSQLAFYLGLMKTSSGWSEQRCISLRNKRKKPLKAITWFMWGWWPFYFDTVFTVWNKGRKREKTHTNKHITSYTRVIIIELILSPLYSVSKQPTISFCHNFFICAREKWVRPSYPRSGAREDLSVLGLWAWQRAVAFSRRQEEL